MKTFERLPQREQEQVVAAVLTAIARLAPPQHRNAEASAEAAGLTPAELWADALADAGLDRCEPWEGFPKRFAVMPEKPRIDLSDYSKN